MVTGQHGPLVKALHWLGICGSQVVSSACIIAMICISPVQVSEASPASSPACPPSPPHTGGHPSPPSLASRAAASAASPPASPPPPAELLLHATRNTATSAPRSSRSPVAVRIVVPFSLFV